MKDKVKIYNMESYQGNKVPNQFKIYTNKGRYFQSYQSVITFINNNGQVYLDEQDWDYSTTTGKYRNMFLGEGIAITMKKKDLLQDWEIVQQEYYEQFNRSSVERLYGEWFGNDIEHYPYMEKNQMIEELIEDELSYRKDDTIKELKETIKHIEKLNFNN